MPRRQPEQAIHRAVADHLRWRAKRGCFWYHVPNGGGRSKVEASILKGLGVRAGVPDLILVNGGRTYALELKAPGGRLSPAQREAHDALRAAGAEVGTAVGVDAALEQLSSWGLLRA
jgi:hypothetical protein